MVTNCLIGLEGDKTPRLLFCPSRYHNDTPAFPHLNNGATCASLADGTATLGLLCTLVRFPHHILDGTLKSIKLPPSSTEEQISYAS